LLVLVSRSAHRASCTTIALDMKYRTTYGEFPANPVILFGVGLGGFFHGIVFRRALQWRHWAGTRHPADSLENMRLKVAS
jgi:uncharacterized membrane protein